MPHGILLLVDIYWRDLTFMTIYLNEILHLWQDVLNILSQVSLFHWPRNIWRLIYFPCHIYIFYFILFFLFKKKNNTWRNLIGRKFVFLQMPPRDKFTYFRNKWACLEKYGWEGFIFSTKIWFDHIRFSQ
jgi:hypothetical protein